MTKAQARRYVMRCVAAVIDAEHPEFLYSDGDNAFTDADVKRTIAALRDLVFELQRRGYEAP